MNEKGCLQAGEEWLEHNLLTVAGIAVGIAFLQVLTKILTPTHIIAVGTYKNLDHHHIKRIVSTS